MVFCAILLGALSLWCSLEDVVSSAFVAFSAVSFFFQAEDGIRDWSVTGVQTCALPICRPAAGGGPRRQLQSPGPDDRRARDAAARVRPCAACAAVDDALHRRGRHEREARLRRKIGRASCRERVEDQGAAAPVKREREEL